MRGAEGQAGVKVVDDLGHDARPVDGVHRHQPAPGGQKILGAEAGLDHRLTGVEIALDRQVVNVRAA